MMFNRSGENTQPYLVPNLKETTLSLLPLNILAINFCKCPFWIFLRKVIINVNRRHTGIRYLKFT